MNKDLDCVVCGSCVADMIVRPVALDRPPGAEALLRVEPIELVPGGMVCNAGIAMARLGLRVAAFSRTGDDDWGELVRRRLDREGLDLSALTTDAEAPTSTTAVLVDAEGRRSFAHCSGAPKRITAADYDAHLPLLSRSRFVLIGYYATTPNLEADLPRLLQRLRAAGCRTALEAAGDGGGMQPLDRCLPHLDIYCPSHAEAAHQTGEDEPRRILETYRACGAPGLLGVKLGARGALLSPAADRFVEIPPAEPPGPVVDTTGAGDTFFAGLIAGLCRGLDTERAGRLAAATAACSITGIGASTAVRDYNGTLALADPN